jgi:hypothetical protein
MAKKDFSIHLSNDEITTHGYMVPTFAKYATVMAVVLIVISGLGFFFD